MKLPNFVPFAVSALMLTSCGNSPLSRTKELRAEIDQINKNYFEAQQASKRLQSQLDAARGERQKLEEALKKVEEEREASKQEVERVKREFDTYKSKYKVSVLERVPGLWMPDFMVGATEYHGVQVTAMDSEMIAFHHDAGLGKLRLGDLPGLARDYLGLSAVHEVSVQPAGEVREISVKKRRSIEVAKLDAEDQKLLEDRKALDATFTKELRRQDTIKDNIARAKARQMGYERLDRELEQVALKMKQIQVEQGLVDLKRQSLQQQKQNIR